MANLLVGTRESASRRVVRREVAPDLEPEATPLAAWWGIEDLWLRLRAQLPVTLAREADGDELVFRGFRREAAGELRYAALDLQRYVWGVSGAGGSFVQRLLYRGDDLVCLLTPVRVLRRWPEGEETACLVRAFLLRLAREPIRPEMVVTSPCPETPAPSGLGSGPAAQRCLAPAGTAT